jgi:hypothetical protein
MKLAPDATNALGVGVLGERLADRNDGLEHAEGALDTAVDLAAEDVGRREVEAGVGVRGVDRGGEGAHADDRLAVADGHDDEFGLGACGEGLAPGVEGSGLAGAEAGRGGHRLRIRDSGA